MINLLLYRTHSYEIFWPPLIKKLRNIHRLAMGIFDVRLLRIVLLVFPIAAGLVVPGISHSQERPIRFGIPEEGYPPYSIGADSGPKPNARSRRVART